MIMWVVHVVYKRTHTHMCMHTTLPAWQHHACSLGMDKCQGTQLGNNQHANCPAAEVHASVPCQYGGHVAMVTTVCMLCGTCHCTHVQSNAPPTHST